MRFSCVVSASMLATVIGCSRQHAEKVEVDLLPLPPPLRVYVDYQGGMSKGAPHAITDKAVLTQIATLVNADHGGWVDPHKQMLDVPIRQVRLDWYSEVPPSAATLDIGSNWIGRAGLIQTIPTERAAEILNLLRWVDASDARPAGP